MALGPESENQVEDWTPALGARRAVGWGVFASLLFGVVVNLVNGYVPGTFLPWIVRTAIAFAVAWALFRVVHWAAGMAGNFCTTLVVGLAIGVMLSQHVVLALGGRWTSQGWQPDWAWCDPLVICLSSVPVITGVGACAILCHGGNDDAGIIGDMFGFRFRG
jgi:hypothetical protein